MRVLMNFTVCLSFLALITPCARSADDSKTGDGVVFHTDFEKDAVDKEANQIEMMVLGDGADIRVKQDGNNKFLEQASAPLDTFGVLFGPTLTDNICVQARIFGTSIKRRYPNFGIGLNGLGGFVLRVNPGKKALELLKNDEVKKSIPYTWTTGTWTVLQLQLRKVKDGTWSAEGKAWQQDKDEPKDWMISAEDSEQPVAGRSTLWGVPYAETPIRFDDLTVKKIK